MTENKALSEQFTGLILLTGTDKPGIASSLFETLAPFAVHVIDIEQIIVNNRLILTVLIGANPAHQSAIEEDLNACASELDVDIATLFAQSVVPAMPQGLIEVSISSAKLHPQSLSLVTRLINDNGANIEGFVRTSENPVSVAITISGASKSDIESAMSSLVFEDQTTFSVREH
jgi:phosphoserine phosphatase